MKVYISGTSSLGEVKAIRQKFEKAENYLLSSGHKVINQWEKYRVMNVLKSNEYLYDLRLLADSQVLFLMDDWLESRKAVVEKAFAESTGKQIWFQDRLEEQQEEKEWINSLVYRVAAAIEGVMELKLCDYRKEGRDRKLFFARMLFAVHCHRLSLLPDQIGEILSRDHTTIRHYLRKYEGEYQFNTSFRKMADRVERRIRRT